MSTQSKATMSVRTMGRLLGLKKVESYWLVHKGYFETIQVSGRMRVVIDSFEEWYAGQIRYHKISGAPPGENLRKESYSVRDIAEILGLSESHVYDLIIQHGIPTIAVQGWKRVTKQDFDKWYAGQTRYRTKEDREKDYFCEETSMSMPEMARLLDVPRKTVYTILENKYGRENLEVIVIAGQKRITKKSFEKWYAGQSVYLKPEDRIFHPEAKNIHYADCLTGGDAKKPSRGEKAGKKPRNIMTEAEYLTPQDIAYLAGVETRSVYRWVREGKLPLIRISKKINKIPRREAEQFLLSRIKGQAEGGISDGFSR